MGGVAGEGHYGEKDGLFEGRIGGGVAVESGYVNDSDNLLGYLETENIFRTPPLKVKGEGDKAPETKVWLSTTVAVAGMATRAITAPKRTGEPTSIRWGGQGDGRVIPEAHASLDTEFTKFTLYGGVTFAVVPHGKVDLDAPQESLALYRIRTHVGGSMRIKIGAIYNAFEQDRLDRLDRLDKEEKAAHRAKFKIPSADDWVYVEISAVGEFSGLFNKARSSLVFGVYDFTVGFTTELERYKDESFLDVRVGGSASYRGVYLRGLQSIRDDDFRVEAGVDFTSFLGT
jgi:hypothetical protein